MKKNLVINSEICDARTIKEGNYEGYEQILLNTEILLVNEYSKEIFHRLPITANAETILETEGEMEITNVNGDFEINGDSTVRKNTALLVNGDLRIGKNTKDVLEQYQLILVNGSVRCPQSMSSCLSGIQINGTVVVVPDDCVELKDDFDMDAYFPLRARENGNYFAYNRVKILDAKCDTAVLREKNIHFVTKALLTREELLPDLLMIVDENTELQVVPSGYAYVKGEVTLNEALIQKHGTKLYVDGGLLLDKDSTPFIEKIEKLQVSGKVSLLSTQVEAFQMLDAEYQELQIVKGKLMKNKPMFSVDATLLGLSEEGITVKNCAQLKIKEDVSAEMIMEKLQIMNCALVKCSPEQRSAIQMVGKNIAKISSGEGTGLKDAVKKMAESKMINAEKYSL